MVSESINEEQGSISDIEDDEYGIEVYYCRIKVDNDKRNTECPMGYPCCKECEVAIKYHKEMDEWDEYCKSKSITCNSCGYTTMIPGNHLKIKCPNCEDGYLIRPETERKYY